MLLDLLLFAAFGLLGLRLQRHEHGDQLRERLWTVNYVAFIPVAAAFAFLTVPLDADLARIVACGLVAWWLTVGLAGAYAYLVARERSMRGALWLVGAFPNTGFIGFPLAHLAFGNDGLRLAIIYDQVSLVVPAIVVSLVIARRHARSADTDEASEGIGRTVVRTMVTSPPLWTVVVLVAARLTVLPDPLQLELLGSIVGAVVGPVGFLLLGLSLPLEGFAHGRRELAETVGAVLVRIAAAPALLWLVAAAAGVDVPPATYLVAAMPTAFHTLVISRLHGLQVTVVRLGILVSSVVVVGTTVTLVALAG